MQTMIKKIAWIMHVKMKTSGSESLSAAGNIFVGQVGPIFEDLLVIFQYRSDNLEDV